MGDASDKPFSYVSHAINPFYATGKSLKKCVREVHVTRLGINSDRIYFLKLLSRQILKSC